MHVNDADLSVTVTRRRVTSGISVNPSVNYIPPENVIKSKTSSFSSFASLWSSAQVCEILLIYFFVYFDSSLHICV